MKRRVSRVRIDKKTSEKRAAASFFLAEDTKKIPMGVQVQVHAEKRCSRVASSSVGLVLCVLIKTDEPPGGLMTPVESASDYRYNVPLESIGILFLIAYRARMFSSLLLN